MLSSTVTAQLNFNSLQPPFKSASKPAEGLGRKVEWCAPGFVGTPPNCRAIPYLPIPTEPPLRCPAGQIGYPPNCYEPCPAFQYGTPPNCHRSRCPEGAEGEFQPHCTFRYCNNGTVGVWPNCTVPRPYIGCPNGELGTPPHCYVPCPAYCKLIHLEFT